MDNLDPSWLALKVALVRRREPKANASPQPTGHVPEGRYVARKLAVIAGKTGSADHTATDPFQCGATPMCLARLPMRSPLDSTDEEASDAVRRADLTSRLDRLRRAQSIRDRLGDAELRTREEDTHSAEVLFASLLPTQHPPVASNTSAAISKPPSTTLLQETSRLLEHCAQVLGAADKSASTQPASELLAMHTLLSASREARSTAEALGLVCDSGSKAGDVGPSTEPGTERDEPVSCKAVSSVQGLARELLNESRAALALSQLTLGSA